MKTVCFTGHRNVRFTPTLRFYLIKLLEDLIYEGADTFYSGGSFGWDNDCSDVVLELKEKYPHIKLCIVMPYPELVQTEGWTDGQKEQYRRILSLADNVECCSEKRATGSEKKRNARLVELADCCVCYCNINRKRSGTVQTVHMALKKRIKVYNLYDDN